MPQAETDCTFILVKVHEGTPEVLLEYAINSVLLPIGEITVTTGDRVEAYIDPYDWVTPDEIRTFAEMNSPSSNRRAWTPQVVESLINQLYKINRKIQRYNTYRQIYRINYVNGQPPTEIKPIHMRGAGDDLAWRVSDLRAVFDDTNFVEWMGLDKEFKILSKLLGV